MISVMISSPVGLPEGELKPAFLMLASCYNELSKRLRSNGGVGANKYQTKAAESLQKVYGTNVPTSEAKTPTAPRHGCLANMSNLPPPQPKSSQATSTEDVIGTRLNKLQREVQSLRDRHTHHSACLSQLRSAKRKLEEDLSEERHCRRKVERELQHTSQELSSARRAENFVAEQCRREVETRRRAEERAIELRDEVMVVRRELDSLGRDTSDKERKTKECFGKLGALFLKVAEGEVGLEGDLLAGLSGGNSVGPDHRKSSATNRDSTGGF